MRPLHQDPEVAGFDNYETTEALCVEVRNAVINTQGGKKPCYVMELRCQESGHTIIQFFNHQLTKSKTAAVKKNSKFAKQFRLATGKNPLPRFSRSDTLKRGFVGIVYRCKYTTAVDSNNNLYFKSKEIAPVNPHLSKDWLSDGTLIPKTRTKIKQSLCKNNESELEKASKNYEKLLDDIPSKNGLSDANFSSLQRPGLQSSSVNSLHHAQQELFDKRYLTIIQKNEKEKVYEYRRRPDESEDDYMQRVIDTSMVDW